MFAFLTSHSRYLGVVRSFWTLLIFLLVLGLSTSNTAFAEHGPGGNSANKTTTANKAGASNDASGWFTVLSAERSGEFLVITYTIRYPGMTKVKLFDDAQTLLWRSQYVNDKEGEHTLRLRATKLVGGSYTFEFDYKNFKSTYPVSI